MKRYRYSTRKWLLHLFPTMETRWSDNGYIFSCPRYQNCAYRNYGGLRVPVQYRHSANSLFLSISLSIYLSLSVTAGKQCLRKLLAGTGKRNYRFSIRVRASWISWCMWLDTICLSLSLSLSFLVPDRVYNMYVNDGLNVLRWYHCSDDELCL